MKGIEVKRWKVRCIEEKAQWYDSEKGEVNYEKKSNKNHVCNTYAGWCGIDSNIWSTVV